MSTSRNSGIVMNAARKLLQVSVIISQYFVIKLMSGVPMMMSR